MKKILKLSGILLILLLLNSCYYDKEDQLYPSSGICDTSVPATYTTTIVPMLQQYCYSCHTGGFPSGNILMGTYAADKAIGQNGSLYGSISYATGYSPMPKGMSKMTSCQIATIKKWVDSGMPNN